MGRHHLSSLVVQMPEQNKRLGNFSSWLAETVKFISSEASGPNERFVTLYK